MGSPLFVGSIMAEEQRNTLTRSQYKAAFKAYYCFATQICAVLQRRNAHLEYALDPVVALNVVVATYDDIDRYKAYHLRNDGTQRSDVVKRAAYFTKWTTKLRPIMFKRIDLKPKPRDSGLMANETLALAWAMELVSSDIDRDIRLSKKSRSEFLYDLHYREMGHDALVYSFQVITDLALGGKPNPVVEFANSKVGSKSATK